MQCILGCLRVGFGVRCKVTLLKIGYLCQQSASIFLRHLGRVVLGKALQGNHRRERCDLLRQPQSIVFLLGVLALVSDDYPGYRNQSETAENQTPDESGGRLCHRLDWDCVRVDCYEIHVDELFGFEGTL